MKQQYSFVFHEGKLLDKHLYKAVIPIGAYIWHRYGNWYAVDSDGLLRDVPESQVPKEYLTMVLLLT